MHGKKFYVAATKQMREDSQNDWWGVLANSREVTADLLIRKHEPDKRTQQAATQPFGIACLSVHTAGNLQVGLQRFVTLYVDPRLRDCTSLAKRQQSVFVCIQSVQGREEFVASEFLRQKWLPSGSVTQEQAFLMHRSAHVAIDSRACGCIQRAPRWLTCSIGQHVRQCSRRDQHSVILADMR